MNVTCKHTLLLKRITKTRQLEHKDQAVVYRRKANHYKNREKRKKKSLQSMGIANLTICYVLKWKDSKTLEQLIKMVKKKIQNNSQ